jgi:outer membrane autotransporter protein
MLIGAPTNSTSNGQGMAGVTLLYDFAITTEASQLLATVTGSGPRVNPQTKALSEGFISGAALLSQGGDTLAGPGMSNAVSAAKGAGAAPALAGFGALSSGSMRLNSGSHVDMRSVSLVTGLSYGTDINPGGLTLGAFFEYGTGSYDTYNSFPNAASVKGKGDNWYIGGGILGHMHFTDTGPGHFYTEGSFRAGRLHNEYKSSDLSDLIGNKASYDSSSNYYGFHLGTGYLWNINEQATLDLYSKYFWTRVEGDSVRLSTGDPIKFKDTGSSRLRLGGRFAYAMSEHISPYIGAAYEHEFDSKARATTNGFDLPAPSLRGNTGIGELGFTLKPSLNLPLSFDLGVQGYTGKREGVTGSLQIRYEF